MIETGLASFHTLVKCSYIWYKQNCIVSGRQQRGEGRRGQQAGEVDGTGHDKCSIILYLTFAEIKSNKLLLRYFYCCLLVLSTFPSPYHSLSLSLHTRLLLCKCQLSCKEMGQTGRQSGTTTGQA